MKNPLKKSLDIADERTMEQSTESIMVPKRKKSQFSKLKRLLSKKTKAVISIDDQEKTVNGDLESADTPTESTDDITTDNESPVNSPMTEEDIAVKLARRWSLSSEDTIEMIHIPQIQEPEPVDQELSEKIKSMLQVDDTIHSPRESYISPFDADPQIETVRGHGKFYSETILRSAQSVPKMVSNGTSIADRFKVNDSDQALRSTKSVADLPKESTKASINQILNDVESFLQELDPAYERQGTGTLQRSKTFTKKSTIDESNYDSVMDYIDTFEESVQEPEIKPKMSLDSVRFDVLKRANTTSAWFTPTTAKKSTSPETNRLQERLKQRIAAQTMPRRLNISHSYKPSAEEEKPLAFFEKPVGEVQPVRTSLSDLTVKVKETIQEEVVVSASSVVEEPVAFAVAVEEKVKEPVAVEEPVGCREKSVVLSEAPTLVTEEPIADSTIAQEKVEDAIRESVEIKEEPAETVQVIKSPVVAGVESEVQSQVPVVEEPSIIAEAPVVEETVTTQNEVTQQVDPVELSLVKGTEVAQEPSEPVLEPKDDIMSPIRAVLEKIPTPEVDETEKLPTPPPKDQFFPVPEKCEVGSLSPKSVPRSPTILSNQSVKSRESLLLSVDSVGNVVGFENDTIFSPKSIDKSQVSHFFGSPVMNQSMPIPLSIDTTTKVEKSAEVPVSATISESHSVESHIASIVSTDPTTTTDSEITKSECDSECDSDCSGHEYVTDSDDESVTNETGSVTNSSVIESPLTPKPATLPRRRSDELEDILVHMDRLNDRQDLEIQRAPDPTLTRRKKIETDLKPIYDSLAKLDTSKFDSETLHNLYATLGTLKRQANNRASVQLVGRISVEEEEPEHANSHMKFNIDHMERKSEDGEKPKRSFMKQIKKRLSLGFLKRKS